MSLHVPETVIQDPSIQIFASGFLTKELMWKEQGAREKRTAMKLRTQVRIWGDKPHIDKMAHDNPVITPI